MRFPLQGRVTAAGLLLCLTAAGCTFDRRQPLTYEAIYGSQAADFRGDYPRGLRWLPDGEHYLERRAGVLQRVHARSAAAAPAYDHEELATLLAEAVGLAREDAEEQARRPLLNSDDFDAFVIEQDDNLWFVRLLDDFVRQLTDLPGEKRVVTLGPNQDRVAYVEENDLYTVAVASGTPVRITADGSDTVFNGVLDWVYQEEVYGRGNWRSYWWSPDGTRLAYLRLDDADVPVYPLVDKLATHPTVEEQRYPKAGDPNPLVQCGIVAADGGKTRWIALDDYDPEQIIIAGVGWKGDDTLQLAIRHREALWLDLLFVDAETLEARRVLRETTPAWTTFLGLPTWLEDGTFLWFSERDGWKHLYHYQSDGTLIRQVTSGSWEVRKLHGVDEARGVAYVTGTRDSHIEEHAYRIPLAGGEPVRLTEPGYSHGVRWAPTWTQFIDTASNVTSPPAVTLRDSTGAAVRALGGGHAEALTVYRQVEPELLRIDVDNGRTLNAELIRPPTRSPFKRWPVMVFTYAGPHGSVVHNRWAGRSGQFKQLLAQQGICVWSIDPYSASGEGAVSAWTCYQQLGTQELADIEASLRWLARHEPVNLERVGISGYSYGGFMVCYALTHSDMFKLGIAGGSVTDWRNYDSIYTETFMRTPANNPVGYAQSSCITAADETHGRLLLVHGFLDNNVHAQNTMQMIDALQRADKQFDLMLYPQDEHGVRAGWQHYQRYRYEWILDKL